MTEGDDTPRDTPVPEEYPALDILMDVQRSREKMMIPAEWLVLFRGALPGVYDGVPHPTRLGTWVGQIQHILEAARIPGNLWVPFAIIQLEGEAARWWGDLQADPNTMCWSSFVGALRDAFGLPLDPDVPKLDLEEEDPEGDNEGNEHADDQAMNEAEELEILEPTTEERRTQRRDDIPEELGEEELCRRFWQEMPDPIPICGTSCEDSFDAQLEDARRKWRAWLERTGTRPHRFVTTTIVRGRRRSTGAT